MVSLVILAGSSCFKVKDAVIVSCDFLGSGSSGTSLISAIGIMTAAEENSGSLSGAVWTCSSPVAGKAGVAAAAMGAGVGAEGSVIAGRAVTSEGDGCVISPTSLKRRYTVA